MKRLVLMFGILFVALGTMAFSCPGTTSPTGRATPPPETTTPATTASATTTPATTTPATEQSAPPQKQ